MKVFNFYFTFLFISLFASIFSANLEAGTVRIATYNVWNPAFEQKYSGKDTWDQRLPFIVQNIISAESDVICLEEVSEKSYQDLVKSPEIHNRFTSHYISHAPSQPGQKEGRDGVAFFYRPEIVTLIKFVQSADGTRPTHRRDFYADLQLNEPRDIPIKFRVAGTHLDSGKDLEIGNAQLSALVEDVQKINDDERSDFVVVCGDFNEGEDEPLRPRQEIMQNAGFITDGSLETTRPEALDVRHKGHVDWIYFKKISALNFDLISSMPIGDERGSDHKLILTDVEFE